MFRIFADKRILLKAYDFIIVSPLSPQKHFGPFSCNMQTFEQPISPPLIA
jgi:hypothetical protein